MSNITMNDRNLLVLYVLLFLGVRVAVFSASLSTRFISSTNMEQGCHKATVDTGLFFFYQFSSIGARLDESEQQCFAPGCDFKP